jgi:hypothetical protein
VATNKEIPAPVFPFYTNITAGQATLLYSIFGEDFQVPPMNRTKIASPVIKMLSKHMVKEVIEACVKYGFTQEDVAWIKGYRILGPTVLAASTPSAPMPRRTDPIDYPIDQARGLLPNGVADIVIKKVAVGLYLTTCSTIPEYLKEDWDRLILGTQEIIRLIDG